MSNGLLGKGVINANTETTLATTSSGISYASVQLFMCNRSATDTATFQLAIVNGSAATSAGDYIEYGVELPPNGTYINNVIVCSAGEQLRVLSDKGNLSYRVGCIEK